MVVTTEKIGIPLGINRIPGKDDQPEFSCLLVAQAKVALVKGDILCGPRPDDGKTYPDLIIERVDLPIDQRAISAKRWWIIITINDVLIDRKQTLLLETLYSWNSITIIKFFILIQPIVASDYHAKLSPMFESVGTFVKLPLLYHSFTNCLFKKMFWVRLFCFRSSRSDLGWFLNDFYL